MTTHHTAMARARAAARAGHVDTLAPVQGSATIEIDATAITTLQALTDLAGWPHYVPGVTRMHVHGPRTAPLGEGVRFSWRNQGAPLTSTIELADTGLDTAASPAPDAQMRVCWTGRALWLVAAHCNTITSLPGGRCRLTSSESMTGIAVTRLMPSDQLDAQLGAFVEAIATEAVRRSPTRPVPGPA